MKTNLFNLNGEKTKQIDLPKFFSSEIREDIVSKVLEANKYKQPYSPSPVAGKQHAAKGKLVHRRHVWISQYGRGMSRVPRKILLRRGSQFNWVAAEIPGVRGGMRAHPPKVEGMHNHLKINKRELRIAIYSALSATANGKFISKKYETLKDKKIEHAPFIIESKLEKVKIKVLLEALKKVLGNLFVVATKKKSVRAGLGKRRGRKYKSNAGLLLVKGKDEQIKTSIFEIVSAHELSIEDLAEGGLGRLTVYTEKAIEELNKKYGDKK